MDTIESGIHPVYFCSTHYIEMLLKAEVPLVFSAFHMSGFAPSQVIHRKVFPKLQDLGVFFFFFFFFFFF